MSLARLSMILAIPCLFISCLSVPVATKKDPGPTDAAPRPTAPAEKTSVVSSPAPGEEDAQLFLDKAQEALDNNHLTEAIKAYISVMAIADQSPGTATAKAAEKALTELTRIGTSLSIEPAEAWLDQNGKQLTESTRSIGKDSSRQPAVYLYQNFGGAKAPVPDAPIFFEFQQNIGTMNAFVNTDAFGRANSSILKLNLPGEAAIVRATPVFKSRGFTYAFKSVFRDFSYLPPTNAVLAMTLAESELGVEGNSLAADILAPELKSIGMQVMPSAGSVQKDSFLSAYRGNAAAVQNLLSASQASYLLLVYVNLDSVRQVEYKGKLYSLFSAYGKATMRLIRSDGSIVYTIPIEQLKGDGGNKADAVKKAYALAHEELLTKLRADLPLVKNALQKE